MRLRIVNDVDVLDALVMGLEPGVDPKGLDADDFLLLVGHGAGNIHHVKNGRDALRLLDLLPAPILLVLAYGNDERCLRIVTARGDLPLQGALESALEVTQRLR